MSAIRPLERADLPEVASLYEFVMRSGHPDPPPGLAPYLARVLLDQPWADETIPSLVYVDQTGSIKAFLGSGVRRARFDGQPIRIGCAGQLVAHPEARHQAVGARLLRAYLCGAQDATITDSASDEIRQIWMMLGGQMAHISCVTWIRVLRPWHLAETAFRERRPAWRRPAGGPLISGLDAVTVRLLRAVLPIRPTEVTAEPLTPSAIIEYLPTVGSKLRLHLDYDRRYLAWLFDELGKLRLLGSMVARLVMTARDGRVLGWYVYFLSKGGISRVLQVVANDRDMGSVLDHMFHDAWCGGAAAVSGRVEPRLLDPLARRYALMLYAGPAALVHSQKPEIIGAISSGESLLTRLDGEWWMDDRWSILSEPNDRGASAARPAIP